MVHIPNASASSTATSVEIHNGSFSAKLPANSTFTYEGGGHKLTVGPQSKPRGHHLGLLEKIHAPLGIGVILIEVALFVVPHTNGLIA